MIGWIGVRREHCACIYATWPDLRPLDIDSQWSNSLIIARSRKIDKQIVYACERHSPISRTKQV
jgi:hypothetical protein